MREIKFRGKAIMSIEELELMGIEHDSGWVYGNLIKNGNRPVITADILEEIDESIYPEWWVVVEPKSVGQFTGLCDKNGKEIYEGDIYKKHNNIYLVIYDNGFKWQKIYDSWLERNVFSDKRRSIISEVDCSLFIEVIGNIYENPELLEGEE